MEQFSGNVGPAFRDIIKVVELVVPDGFQASDSREGGELDEEVGVDVEELSDQVVVAVCGGAVHRRSEPPLIAGALPSQREELRRHF